MDFGRWRAGEWTIAVSAVVLGVSLFLPWYSAGGFYLNRSVGKIASETDLDFTAWEIFSVVDILLMGLVVLAILAVLRTADPRSISDGLFGEGLLTIPAFVMSIVVIARVLNVPGDLEPIGDAIDLGIGAWLGLAATLGIFGGSLAAMRNEWIGSRPVPPIETLPAPPRDESTPT